jgi:CelD/BcsL family acetyltransferase involved in cellulose biosynthesis
VHQGAVLGAHTIPRDCAAHVATYPALVAQALRGGADVFTRLEAEWRRLCLTTPYDAPFHRPEVIRAYVEAFAGNSELVVITVRAGDRLVAVLPLISESTSISGIPARRLRSAGNVHTARYDLVHVPELRQMIIPALWTGIERVRGWDVLDFSAVPRGSALAQLVRLARMQGFAAHGVRAATSPYVSLESQDALERLLARTQGRFRANLRRRMRKLQGSGTVRLTRATSSGSHLQRFYALERAGWKGSANTAIAQDTRTLAFYDTVARTAERFGYLSLYTLECGGRAVAMQYGLMERGRYFVLKTAYDEAFRECSPGQLITLEILRDLIERDCAELDFLGLPMDWKRDWAPKLRPHANWYVFRGPLGFAAHLVQARARRLAGVTLRKWRSRTDPGRLRAARSQP